MDGATFRVNESDEVSVQPDPTLLRDYIRMKRNPQDLEKIVHFTSWNITTNMRKSSGKGHAITTSARTSRHYCNTFRMNRLSKSSILAAGLDATSRRSPNSVTSQLGWKEPCASP